MKEYQTRSIQEFPLTKEGRLALSSIFCECKTNFTGKRGDMIFCPSKFFINKILEWGKSLKNKMGGRISNLRSSSGSHSSYQCESTVGDTFSSFSFIPIFKESSSKHWSQLI